LTDCWTSSTDCERNMRSCGCCRGCKSRSIRPQLRIARDSA
jgi:hypothetical protein